MANDSLGSIITQGNFLRIDNAFVDEVSSSGRNTGFIIISYSVPWQSGVTTVQQLRLNVNNNTAIMNSFRMPIRLSDIRRGMRVDVTFSPSMTRSIPPQSTAFTIVTRQPPRPSANTTTQRVIWIDCNNSQLLAGMPNNISRITRYIVTSSTVILNRNGFPIRLCDLRPGQLVQITHATFQTASIPPQTTAFRIQVR